LRTGRTFWFITAALCVAVAAVIFAGRTMLAENLGNPAYRALIITTYALLGGAAGSLTKAFSYRRDGS
jgi:hypothetical protein